MPKFTPEHWRTVEAVFLTAGLSRNDHFTLLAKVR